MKITASQLKVFEFIKATGARWITVSQIVHHTDVENSVVNRFLRRWCKEGLLERNDMFPCHLYHLSEAHETTPLWERLSTALYIWHELESAEDSQTN